MFFWILVATFLASAVSLVLVGVLLLAKRLIHKISFMLVSFAAGALLATGFLDTMPEAVKLGGQQVYLWVTVSIAGFFMLERLFFFVHHHDDEEDDDDRVKMPTGLLIFGDGLHNLIDGVAIASAYLVDLRLGMVTTLAVFIHEIPHELGDFGILIHKGWKRREVLWTNAATGATAILGAVSAFYFGNSFDDNSSRVYPGI